MLTHGIYHRVCLLEGAPSNSWNMEIHIDHISLYPKETDTLWWTNIAIEHGHL